MMLGRMLATLVRRSRLGRETGGAEAALKLRHIQALIANGDTAQAELQLSLLVDTTGAPGAEVHRLLGSLFGARGRLGEARSTLERALVLEPDHPGALADLGNVHRLSGRLADAETSYRRSLALDRTNRSVRLNLALLEAEAGRTSAAIAGLFSLLDVPAHPEALRVLIELLDRLGRASEAKVICLDVLGREPDHAAAHAALGFVLLKRDLRPAAALEHFDRALAVGLDSEDVLSNRGIALQDLGRLDAAIASYGAALNVNPQFEAARFHRALARLMRCEFEHAWPDYELRLKSHDRPPPVRQLPAWAGENLANRSLLVYGEQGLGDEIMFASCIPDLLERCPRLVLACTEKLVPIFRRSFPGVEVMSLAQAREPAADRLLSDAAAMVAIGSLPQYFRDSRERFPCHNGYLAADPELVSAFRVRLERLGSGPKIGFSWRGGTVMSRRAMRTIGQAEVAKLLDMPGARFVNLQYDSDGTEPEIAGAIATGQLTHWPDALDDYDRTAALVGSLDLVVSVCTSVIHLAGALGRPVWVMAPFSPEWRYGIDSETMPWYPSVRIMRQTEPGDWTDVIESVRAQLHALGA